MKWEHLLKKQWTEDDYDHPLIKRLFTSLKGWATTDEVEYLNSGPVNPEPEFKALKLFEDVCSNYEISMFEDSATTLLVKLPNTSLTAYLFNLDSMKKILIKQYPEVYIRLKGKRCPVCVKPPPRGRLPFFDYLVSMVGLAASDGRGTNIEAFNLANDLIEGGVEWDSILYTPVYDKYDNKDWYGRLADDYHNSDKLDFILETLAKYDTRYKEILLSEIAYLKGEEV